MSAGPGRYDEEATALRVATDARGVVLLVVDGMRGTGFSVQMHSLEDVKRLPGALRDLASQIDADLAAGKITPGKSVS